MDDFLGRGEACAEPPRTFAMVFRTRRSLFSGLGAVIRLKAGLAVFCESERADGALWEVYP